MRDGRTSQPSRAARPGHASCADRLGVRAPFSYRADPDVPAFPDERPLIVFDGVCVLCSGFAGFVMAHDAAGLFRLTMAQGPIGQGLFRHYGLDAENFETNLLIEEGRAYGKLEAARRILARLGWSSRVLAGMLGVTRGLPPRWQDGLYDIVARNRYRLFGKTERCMLPPADRADRILA